MVTGIKTGKRGASEIMYPMTNKKGQKSPRIEAMCVGGGLIDCGYKKGIVRQFQTVWQAGHRGVGDNLLYKYMLSWSRNELDPDDPASIDKALEMGREIMENLCHDRQWILVIQKDGRSGLVHGHGMSNALHNDLRAACGRETSYSVLRDVADKTLQRHGIEVDLGKNHKKRDKKLKRHRDHAKRTDGYSWTEYMEQTIDNVIEKTTRKGDFEPNLNRAGISITRKDKSGWTFKLDRSPDGKYDGKTIVYTRFKKDFSNKNINRRIDENYAKLREKQKQEEQQRLHEEHIRQIAEHVAEVGEQGQLSGEDEFLLKIMAERDEKIRKQMDKGLGE